MEHKKSWDEKWYTSDFLGELKATAQTRLDGDLEITEKYAPDAESEIAIDPRLLSGPLGQNAKRMAPLPNFILDKLKMRLDDKGLADFRESSSQIASAVCVKSGVRIVDAVVLAEDDYEIPIRVYYSEQYVPDSPCLYFMHGGGFIGGDVPPYDEVWKVFVEKFHMVVVSAAYRLMPENPYPMPHEDCYRVLEWIHSHAEDLVIDKSLIFVCGDSAGGNLAQYCSTRSKGTAMVRGQILLYATLNMFGIKDQYYNLDGSNFVYEPKQKKISQCIVRQTELMVKTFHSLHDHLGISAPDPFCNPYTFDAEGNPPTFISVGALDFLKNDCIAWAHKLHDAGVPVKVVVYNGMGHGYLNAMGVFPQAEDVIDEIGAFIQGLCASR